MKKIIALLVGILMVFSAFAVSAKVPDFMKENYNNYTADYAVKVEMNNPQDLYALFEESSSDVEEISRHVDLKALIKSIFDSESKINIQCAVSDNFEKFDIAVTSEGKNNLEFNANFNADLTCKSGLWMHADFETEAPEFMIVYQTPIHNKYEVIDVMKHLSEDEIEKFCEAAKAVFTPELVEKLTDLSTGALEKYADISQVGRRCTVHMDNDDFVSMIDELFTSFAGEIASATDNLPEDLKEEMGEVNAEDMDIPVLDDLKIFGDKGLTVVYELNGQGKISSCSLNADIEFSIGDIYTQVSGEEWEYSASGLVDMDISVNIDVYNVGKTKPDFPELTEENSFESENVSIGIIGSTYDDYYNYPNPFVYGYLDETVEKDGLLYFPMEEVLKECYGETVNTEGGSTAITIESEWFKDIDYITVSVGGDVAYTDTAEYNIGEVIEVDGVIYVSEKFFTEVLGWTFEEYTEDYINGECEYSFSANLFGGEDYYEMYPYPYVWANFDGCHIYDEMYYVPLRMVMEDAYSDEATITYSNGSITMESKWFTVFDSLVMNVGSSECLTDGVSHTIGEVKLIDSSVYVPVNLFTDVFGWELEVYRYDRVDDTTTVSLTAESEY